MKNYQFVSNLSQTEYDGFIKKSSMVNLLQTYNWAQVKTEWDHFHCGLYRDGELIGVCLILSRRIIKNITMFYIPRGYVMDLNDAEAVAEMTKNIKQLAKSRHAYLVKLQPNFCVSDNGFKGEPGEGFYTEDHDIKHRNLIAAGFKHKIAEKQISKSFQPDYQAYLPVCDPQGNILDFETVRKNCKNRIKRYSGKYQVERGVTFEITDDLNRLDDLIPLLEETEEKQNIKLRSKEYFERIMNNYKGYAYMMFAKVDLDIYKAFLLKDKKTPAEKLEEVDRLRAEKGQFMLLSGYIFIMPENEGRIKTCEALYAGNSQVLTNLHVSAAIVFELLKFCIERQVHYLSLGGIEGDLKDNLSTFKSRFTSRVMVFAGEYDLPVSWLYYPVKVFYSPAMKIYKKMMKKNN